MSKLTAVDIIKKYPEVYGVPPFDPKESLLCFGFECSPHWFPELEKLSEKISEEIKASDLKNFKVVQVKEKFGHLSFYVQNGNQRIQDLIHETTLALQSVCENCGAPNAKRVSLDGYITTLCDKCFEEKSAE